MSLFLFSKNIYARATCSEIDINVTIASNSNITSYNDGDDFNENYDENDEDLENIVWELEPEIDETTIKESEENDIVENNIATLSEIDENDEVSEADNEDIFECQLQDIELATMSSIEEENIKNVESATASSVKKENINLKKGNVRKLNLGDSPTNYLTFTIEEEPCQFSVSCESASEIKMKWVLSDGTETSWMDVTLGSITSGLTVGMKVLFKGNGFKSSDTYHFIMSTGKVKVSGSVTSFIDGTGTGDLALQNGQFQGLFSGCTAITSVPELPSTSLADNCYKNMFKDCTNITLNAQPSTGRNKEIKIPITSTAAINWNDGMFDGCGTGVDLDGSGGKTLLLNTRYYTVGADTTYTVTAHYEDGATPDLVNTVKSGSSFSALPDPTYSGHTFNGWYDASVGGNKYSFPLIIGADTHLYAHWTTTPSPTPPTPTPVPPSGGGGGSGSGGGGGGGTIDPSGKPLDPQMDITDNNLNFTKEPKVTILSFNIDSNTKKNVEVIKEPIITRDIEGNAKLNLTGMDGVTYIATNCFYDVEVKNEFAKNGRSIDTYYIDEACNIVTGWIETLNKNRYFMEIARDSNEGKMCHGWKKIVNDWYFFDYDGSMMKGRKTPDGFVVDGEGKMTNPTLLDKSLINGKQNRTVYSMEKSYEHR